MKLKNKIKSYAFWVALSSAVVILVQSIGKLFGLNVEGGIIENVIMSICGVLVVLGIVTKSDNAEDNKSVVEETSNASDNKQETSQDVVIGDEDSEK